MNNRAPEEKALRKIHPAVLAPYNVYPAKTGGKKFIAFFFEYLSALLPVDFISVKDNRLPEKLEPFFRPIMGSGRLRYANPLLYFRLKKVIAEAGITDLIIVHPYFGWLAWLLKRRTGISLSLLSHNIEGVRFKSMGKWWWKGLWWYEKMTHRIIDHNFFVTAEDRAFAIAHFQLDPEKCFVVTYGTERKVAFSRAERIAAATKLRAQFNIGAAEKILLFNGTLDYLPNIEAIRYIVDEIGPRLSTHGFEYRIIICGKGLSDEFKRLKNNEVKNITYAGFVEDIDLFFAGADIFINPVITGGGIKTKLVEALACGVCSVSTATGAFGVSAELTGGALTVAADFNWDNFVAAIIKTQTDTEIPEAFFNHFYWGNIAAKAAQILERMPGTAR